MSTEVPPPDRPALPPELHAEDRTVLGPSSPARARPRRTWVLLVLLPGLLAAAGLWLWARGTSERDQALAALDRLDLDAAAVHLDRHLARHPDDTAAWFLAGRTARRLGRFLEAEKALEKCQALGGVTDATRLEWDLLRVQRGDLADVDTRLRMTIPPEHPDAPLVLEALARGYLRTDRLPQVVEACDLWAARQPDHPWPYLWRGNVYEQLANFHEAQADYERALRLAPPDGPVHLDVRRALGNLFVRARQPANAVEHFQVVLARIPDDREALLGLAACRIEEGRAEEAVPLLDRLLAHDSPPARACYLRGRAALELRDLAAAQELLSRAVRLAPDDAESLHQLILTLRAAGQSAEADSLAPRLEAVRQDRARLDTLIRTIARRPDDADLRHEAGVICLRLGRDDEGERWLLSVLRFRPDHRPTHAALAEHFGRRNDPRADAHARAAKAS